MGSEPIENNQTIGGLWLKHHVLFFLDSGRDKAAGSGCLWKFWWRSSLGISLACFVFSPNTNPAAENPLFDLSVGQHKNRLCLKRNYGVRFFFYCFSSAPWRRSFSFLWAQCCHRDSLLPSLSPGLHFERGPCLSKMVAFHDKAFLGRGSYSYTFLSNPCFALSIQPCHFLYAKRTHS